MSTTYCASGKARRGQLETSWRDSTFVILSISFSMEFGGSKISYLDLLISLEPHHNALRPTFQVHCKPTFTGVSIHRDSLHPAAQTHAVINSAIHRLKKGEGDRSKIDENT